MGLYTGLAKPTHIKQSKKCNFRYNLKEISLFNIPISCADPNNSTGVGGGGSVCPRDNLFAKGISIRCPFLVTI